MSRMTGHDGKRMRGEPTQTHTAAPSPLRVYAFVCTSVLPPNGFAEGKQGIGGAGVFVENKNQAEISWLWVIYEDVATSTSTINLDASFTSQAR